MLRRDKFLCQNCLRYGKRTEATTVHHLVPLKDNYSLRLTSSNLLSLCNDCHNRCHNRNDDELSELGIELRDRKNKKYLKTTF